MKITIENYFKKIFTVKSIAETGILTSLSITLQIVANFTFGPMFRFIFAEGWAPWIGMVPIYILLARRGVSVAATASLISSVICFLATDSAVTMIAVPGAFALDFLGAKFASVIVAGTIMLILKKKWKESTVPLYASIVICTIIGFMFGTWSGVVFYAEYVPSGYGVWFYSLIFNFSAWIISCFFAIVIVLMFNKTNKQYVRSAGDNNEY